MLFHIQVIHAEVKQAYGSPRMVKALRVKGLPASKDRVEQLMQANGIVGKHKRKYKVTTDSKRRLPVAPNVLNRNFNPEEPNQA